jgi:uncharacterized membrane protein
MMGQQPHPAIRVVLAALGALAGASVSSGGDHFFAIVMGALAGLALFEVVYIRDRLTKLEHELHDLKKIRPEPRRTPAAVPDTAQGRREAVLDVPSTAPVRVSAPQPTPAAAPADVKAPYTDAPSWTSPRPLETSYAPQENPIVALLRGYFTGGNALVRAGIVVLFFGVAFLLRYLAEHTHIPIELRLSGVAFGALVLLGLGWRLRSKRRGYALALQGGAIGILYLTVFSALHLYSLLTPAAAFVLLAIISALGAALAVMQGSLAVALLAVTGGFLAPFLASTGAGNHVALFSYFVVLNAVILAIAWFRSWRPLNLAGFTFTFVLSTVWGVLQYRPQDFASTEPFLALFFLIYVAIAVLYSSRQAPILENYIDGTIIFGTPIAAFGLQAAMLHDQRFALAYSALAVSALYVVLAWLLHRRRGGAQRQLVEAFMALGVAFLTLAIPLALNGRWSAASWALEGAALIWVGCRQNRRLPRAFGALLQLAAGSALALGINTGGSIPAGTYIAGMMVGLASIYASVLMNASKAQLAEYELPVPGFLFLWGLLWWCIGGMSELGQHIDKAYTLASTLMFATITAFLCSELARRASMRIALLPAFGFAAVMVLFALRAAAELHHPLAQGGWIAWPLGFVGMYLILSRHDNQLAVPAMNALHAVTLWLFAALGSWELAWAVSHTVGSSGAWSIIAWAIVPAVILAVLPDLAPRIRWPLQVHREAYLLLASAGFALYLGFWSFQTDVLVSSPSAPLPYLPLVNPLDITQALVLFIVTRFCMRLRSEPLVGHSAADLRPAGFAVALLAFLWLNAVLLRTLHLWAGMPYELRAMLNSTLVESALSIFWAFLALATMLIATRIRARIVWLTGAVLLAVVVTKLFLVDLSSIGTVERIVSFVGVGLLMLVLGYFSPLPPVAEERL